jgi:hypothetical protein
MRIYQFKLPFGVSRYIDLDHVQEVSSLRTWTDEDDGSLIDASFTYRLMFQNDWSGLHFFPLWTDSHVRQNRQNNLSKEEELAYELQRAEDLDFFIKEYNRFMTFWRFEDNVTT